LQDQPTFVLILHERHDKKTKSIPYSKQAFEKVSAGLFQHRSLALSIPRTSTAIFNSRRVEWAHNGSNEQSIGKSNSDTILHYHDYFAGKERKRKKKERNNGRKKINSSSLVIPGTVSPWLLSVKREIRQERYHQKIVQM
jgi:hypothetical protein